MDERSAQRLPAGSSICTVVDKHAHLSAHLWWVESARYYHENGTKKKKEVAAMEKLTFDKLSNLTQFLQGIQSLSHTEVGVLTPANQAKDPWCFHSAGGGGGGLEVKK